MGLRETAESDLQYILEDSVFGFGWDITVTDPLGVDQLLTGYSSDISQLIDPETGVAMSGRLATVAIRVASLTGEFPRAIANASQKPWLVTFNDIAGNSNIFKVRDSDPDRVLGVLVLTLEFWRTAP